MQPIRHIIVCRGKATWGMSWGGTCSGSTHGSLYWGTGRVIDFLAFPVQKAESVRKRGFPLFCWAMAGLRLTMERLEGLGIAQQLDPAINVGFALGLEEVELFAQGVGGQDALGEQAVQAIDQVGEGARLAGGRHVEPVAVECLALVNLPCAVFVEEFFIIRAPDAILP